MNEQIVGIKYNTRRRIGVLLAAFVVAALIILGGIGRGDVYATYCCASKCNTCDCCVAVGGCQCSKCENNCCTECTGTGGCSGCCKTGCNCPDPPSHTCPWFDYKCACNSGSCFPAGTKISMADGSYMNIEDVGIGDVVLSYDTTLNKQVLGEVTILENPVREGLYMLNGGLVEVTNEHPFYVRKDLGDASVEAWASIQPEKTHEETPLYPLYELEIGDYLYTENEEWIELVSMEYKAGAVQTYNLKGVADTNTFYADGLLVHNKGGCTCNCDCSGLAIPTAVTLVSPAANATNVPNNDILFDWNPPGSWGQDQKSCKNDTNSCACNPGDSGIYYNYDFFLDVYTGNLALPLNSCPGYDPRFTCGVTNHQLLKQGLNLQGGQTYVWAVRAVNPGPGGSPGGNGVSCTTRGPWAWRIFTANNPPEFISVTPNSVLSGTFGDSDNGPTCDDNNAMVVTARYRDLDGCSDMKKLYFWLDDQSPHVTQLYSSGHGSVQLGNDGIWRLYGLAFKNYGFSCPDGSTGWQCYKNYAWDLAGGSVPITGGPCSPDNAADHSDHWDMNTCIPDWGSTPVGYGVTGMLCDGNDMYVQWSLYFNDDDSISALPYNEMDFWGYVHDSAGSGPVGGWMDAGDWRLDFDLPSATARAAHKIGDEATSLRFYHSASELAANDSGLDSIWYRSYRYYRDGTWSGWINLLNPNFPGLGGVLRWPDSGEYESEYVDFEGGDVVRARVGAVDMACNMRIVNGPDTEVSQSWIETYRGYVYGWRDYDNPIQLDGEHMSTHWLGGMYGACSDAYFGNGVGSLFEPWWCSETYPDGNRKDWYQDLYTTALSSEWIQPNQGGEVIETSTINLSDGVDGIYKYTGGSVLTLSGTISGRKLIFIPGGKTVNLDPVLERADYSSPTLSELSPEFSQVYPFSNSAYREFLYAVEADEGSGRFYYVAGDMDFNPYSNQWLVQARDKATHNVVWQGKYPSTTRGAYSRAYDLELSGGYLYVCGGSVYQRYWRFEKYNATTGQLRGSIQADPHPNGHWGKGCMGMAVDANYVYGVGNSKLSTADHEMIIEKHSSADSLLLNDRVIRNPTPYRDFYNDVVLDNGILYLVGFENYYSGDAGSDGRWIVETRYASNLVVGKRRTYDITGQHDLAKAVVASPGGIFVVGQSGGVGRIEKLGKGYDDGLGVIKQLNSTTAISYNSVDYHDGVIIVGGLTSIEGERVSLVEIRDASDLSVIASYTHDVSPANNEYFNDVDFALDKGGGAYSVYAGGANFNGSAYQWHIEEINAHQNRTKDGLILVGQSGSDIRVTPGTKATDGGGDGTQDDARSRFAYGPVDLVQAAVITDGSFNISPDTVGSTYDRVGMEGLAFYLSGNMDRNLLADDAPIYPAVEIHHDPRFLFLFRDMLGKRQFTEFECGIVSGVDLCEDW